MGLLDSVIGALGQGGQGQAQGDLLNAVVGMLGNDSPLGGLAGLAAKFQQGGLGDVLQSWVSTGQNQPISGDQLHDVLGSDTLSALARQLGVSPGDAAGQLSSLLPQVIDKLTPHGQMPQGGLGQAGDLLGALLKR
jgi:uncharacterized protein YidB (DUF937 family)